MLSHNGQAFKQVGYSALRLPMIELKLNNEQQIINFRLPHLLKCNVRRRASKLKKMSNKLNEWWHYGGRIPRKVKNKVLGNRVSGCKLRRMLKETVVGDPIKTMYEMVDFTPHGAFCPHCGEKNFVGTGNKSSYPEHWEYFNCLRCRKVVGYIDNSPFVHALECKECGYDPVF